MTELIVTMKHVRKARMCSSGGRSFFKKHDLDWSSFLEHGIEASVLLDTGDAMAKRVVEVAHGEE